MDGEQALAAGGLLGSARPVMDVLGEPAVGLFIALESIVPPVPSEPFLPLAGFLARTDPCPSRSWWWQPRSAT